MFYLWESKFSGMDISEVRRLKRLENENSRLKRLVAGLTLDKTMFQSALAKPAACREGW